MSAAEIIEQIKTLPLAERRQVIEFVREAVADEDTREAKFQRVADAVFRKYDEALGRLAQ